MPPIHVVDATSSLLFAVGLCDHLANQNSIIPGCSFFAYSWKLPAYNGAFLLTVENSSFLLTVGAFLLTVGKCV